MNIIIIIIIIRVAFKVIVNKPFFTSDGADNAITVHVGNVDTAIARTARAAAA